MNLDLTDHVAGLDELELARLVAEAEAGHDLSGIEAEPNPHHDGGAVVPEDLLAEIDARARREGKSPGQIVRDALTQYLRSA